MQFHRHTLVSTPPKFLLSGLLFGLMLCGVGCSKPAEKPKEKKPVQEMNIQTPDKDTVEGSPAEPEKEATQEASQEKPDDVQSLPFEDEKSNDKGEEELLPELGSGS